MQKCGSTNTVKNGRTSTGQQQYHCRACGVYTVTGDRARDRAIKMALGRHRTGHKAGRRLGRRATDLPPPAARCGNRCLPITGNGVFCYTDEYFVYRQVLPAMRHRPRPERTRCDQARWIGHTTRFVSGAVACGAAPPRR